LNIADALLHEDPCFLQTVGNAAWDSAVPGHLSGLPFGPAQPVDHGALSLGKSPEQCLAELADPDGVTEHLSPALQRLVLPRHRGHGVDLRKLKRDDVQPVPARRLRRAQLGRAASRLHPPFVQRRHAPPQRRGYAEFVDQAPLLGRVRQAVLLVLAVDRHETGSQTLQGSHRDRHVVDPRPAPPSSADLPPDHDRVASGDAELVEHGVQLAIAGHGEMTLDAQRRAAGANHVRLRPSPGQQLERLHEQRLARAGLPRQRHEAGRRLEHHRLDDPQAMNLQALQHAAMLAEDAAAARRAWYTSPK